tara:strand:- start:2465 stop:2800 length:336 start_codon:yes stop_codon:yes gene_type:complete
LNARRNFLMADTIGDMVDKLTIANIRLWNLEDERREVSLTQKELQDLETKAFLKRISATNRERNSLIDQINAALGVLIDKALEKDSTFTLEAHELLGLGKNKFYKTEDRQL